MKMVRQQRHRWISCFTIVLPCLYSVKVTGHVGLPRRCVNKAVRNSHSKGINVLPLPLACPGGPRQDRGRGIFCSFLGAPELSFDNQDSDLHPRLFIREDISYAGTAFYLLSLPVVLIQQSGPVKNWRYGDCLLVSCHNLKK